MSNNVDIKINEIKETFFIVREELFIPDPNKMVKIEMYHRMGVNTEIKRLKFTLSAYIHYEDSTDKLAEILVDNYFELPFMHEYQVEDNNLILPSEKLLIIVRESIAHVRALFQIRLRGTVYQQVIVPLDDATNVTKHFFPNLIKNESGVMSDLIGKVEA